MNDNAGCIFCQIVEGQSPARVLLENEHCMAFLDIAPAGKGHTLVIPKKHSVDILDSASEALSEVMRMTKEVSQLLDTKLKPDGLSLFQMNRTAGWQTVFHFHVHIVPRWNGDSLIEPWVETLAPDLELNKVYSELTNVS
ncbi:MAG TPA: HIT family protein [Candidatus Paceibacterota bacterium]|nr:HIT family protein [Candidatus Paceibacterota bacterium]